MKKLIFMITLFVGLTGFKTTNTRLITGTVYSADDKQPLTGAAVKITGTTTGTFTDADGHYKIKVTDGSTELAFSFIGYETVTVKTGNRKTIDVYLKSASNFLAEVMITGNASKQKKSISASVSSVSAYGATAMRQDRPAGIAVIPANVKPAISPSAPVNIEDESYKGQHENEFLSVKNNPLSTFSVDVDAASYSNFRRFITGGQLPPPDAIRIEEMINYFKYNLAGPTNNEPVAIHTELSSAPWNSKHRLLRIALKAKTIPTEKLPPSNLVFLIDVSGSMYAENKLPLVKSSLKMLVEQLRPQDKVALVVYAGAAGLVLPPTPGDKKDAINKAIDNLSAGGSTAGGAGIRLAYKTATENLIKNGNNRIILATDGDFNVGASSDDDMEKLITSERENGIFLSVLGYGMGNYKDSKMETLADKGNGNYAYIDNAAEAHRTLVSEFGGTLFTVAKDVKLQVEFNPAKVNAYRLLGYEDRILNKEDFNNDRKDAGDMGSGHNVTAFYEIIPAGSIDNYSSPVDELRYQKTTNTPATAKGDEMLTIKFRYKEPASLKSKLSQTSVKDSPVDFNKTSTDFRFAAAVAETGMLLKNSPYKQHASYSHALKTANAAKGSDADGYRAEFIRLAGQARLLSKAPVVANINNEE